MTLHIVTVVTDTKYYFPYLEQTCRDFGVTLTALGIGENWGGYVWKIKKTIEFLQTLPPTDIVCFVDGYDVICLRNLSELPPVFLALKKRERCKIIVAEDKPYVNAMASIYFGSCDNTYINSGTYIGNAGDLLYILTSARHKYVHENDDQKLLTNFCKISPNDFYIDRNCELFYLTTSVLREVHVPEKYNPFFLHAAGCGYMTNVLSNMGYNVDNDIKNELRSYYYNKSYKHVRVFCGRYIIHIIVIVLIIVLLLQILKKNDIKIRG